jgi:hypothetical protein
MAPTSLSVEDVRADIELSGEDRRLRRLWSSIPADRWTPEEAAFRLLLEAADRYEGDFAWASLQLQALSAMGAVTLNGGAVKRSAEFPVIEDLIPGSQRYIELQNREREDARERELEADNRVARENFEASPLGRQQAETRELIHEEVDAVLRDRLAQVADEVIEERLNAILEPEAVQRLRERLGASHRVTSEGEVAGAA